MPKRAPSKALRRAVTTIAAVAAVAIVVGCGDGSGTGASEGKTIRINIPPNASKLVEQGRAVPGVPARITGTVGDTLVIENRDSSTQFVAGYSISPGQTLRIPLNRAGNYETNCSAHKDKSLTMSITES
jgi:plastocyanin